MSARGLSNCLMSLALLCVAVGCDDFGDPLNDGKAPPPVSQAPEQPKPTDPTAKAPTPAPPPPKSVTGNDKAPDVFRAKFTTTKGDFVVEVHRDWAPNGADRFYTLVKTGFFDECKFFRAVENFMVQFGISGKPAANAEWEHKKLPDDPVVQSNARGFVTFAQTSMPNSRGTQVFINFKDNSFLDKQRFAPFAKVISGMEVVDSLYKGYGDNVSDQEAISKKGNAYLEKNFPKLDGIVKAVVLADGEATAAEAAPASATPEPTVEKSAETASEKPAEKGDAPTEPSASGETKSE